MKYAYFKIEITFFTVRKRSFSDAWQNKREIVTETLHFLVSHGIYFPKAPSRYLLFSLFLGCFYFLLEITIQLNKSVLAYLCP